MDNRQPSNMQPVRLSPEMLARLQEEDRQWRLQYMPPQLDINGVERLCVFCHSPLHPLHNRNYDGTTGGFCNKLCARYYEKKMMEDGMGIEGATNERDKYEDWKPKRHSEVV